MTACGPVLMGLGAGDEAAARALRSASLRSLLSSPYTAEQVNALLQWPGDDLRAALRAGTGDVLGAFVGTDLVGFCRWALGERPHLMALFVHPDHARRGVGRALLRAAQGRCHAAGADRLYVGAALNAVPFYRHHGFRPCQGYLWWLPSADGGDLVPVRLCKMVKTLNAAAATAPQATPGWTGIQYGNRPPAAPCPLPPLPT